MLSNSNQLHWMPWPASTKAVDAQAIFSARCYGALAGDLDLDFENTQRPLLITQLLGRCLRQTNDVAYTESTLWEWSLNRRLQGVLAITAATIGPTVLLRAKCSATDCGEELELPLELAMFQQANEPETLCCKLDDTTQLALRLPTGKDQDRWLNQFYGASQDLALSMARSLVSSVQGELPQADWRLPEAWLDPVAEALAESDPLTALSLHSQCPVCHEDNELELDLEGWLLQQLADEQVMLLRQVHRLASVYHWSEEQIISLPQRRRNDYLTLINKAMTT